MHPRIIEKILAEANRLKAAGFPFHSQLLVLGVEARAPISYAERVVGLLRQRRYDKEAIRLEKVLASK